MPTLSPTLPSVGDQAERLIALGLPQAAGFPAAQLRAAAAEVAASDTLLVLDPLRAPVSLLAPLLERAGRRGFVVSDMTDVDDFRPAAGAQVPDGLAYLVEQPSRGDELANWSPQEALPALTAAGRTPLTLGEGIHWLLQQPEVLERKRCFMTIGSRLHRADGSLDSRTPALWVSNGTGRDGPDNRNAPKVGWCWAGNRHTWLGHASAAGRRKLAP